MTPRPSTEELTALGLSDAACDLEETIVWQREAIGEGKGEFRTALTLAAVLARGFGPDAFAPVRSVALEARGATLARLIEDPRYLHVTPGPGRTLQFHSVPSAKAAWAQDLDDPEAIYILTDSIGPFALLGTVIYPVGYDLHVFGTAHPLTIAPFAQLESDVKSWCASSDDRWLIEAVDEQLDAGDSWHAGVAVGMYARLRVEHSLAETRRIVEDARAGRVNEVLAAPRRWARALHPDQVATLRDLALSETMALLEAIEELDGVRQSTDETWQRSVLDLCHRRDDLQSVWLLLKEAVQEKTVLHSLSILDEEGAAFMHGLPNTVEWPADERLRRATAIDPLAWWTIPARRQRV